MARRPRHIPPGVTVHVVQRGVDRRPCFFDDGDRRHYLGALREAAMRRGCAIHAHVLMTNHVHLLVTPDRADGVSRLMQDLGRIYVRHVNDAHGRTGTLWQGRFHASLVGDESYVLACHRYIEQNPLRAGIVRLPDDYPWSSYRENASGLPGGLLTPHPTYLAISTCATVRGENYRALFRNLLPTAETERIRDALQRQSAYGSEQFRGRVARAAGFRVGCDGRLMKVEPDATPQNEDLSLEPCSDPSC
jgi:putative transposase